MRFSIGNMSRRRVSFFLILVLATALPEVSNAQDFYPEDSLYNDWEFRIGPYFWLVSLKGEIVEPPGIPDIPPPTQLPNDTRPGYEIDIDFKDFQNSLKFALMLTGQYRSNHLVTQFNFSSFILESEVLSPKGVIFDDNLVKFSYAGGDLGFGYRMVKQKSLDVDLLFGAKFIFFDVNFSSDVNSGKEYEASRSVFWIDPVLCSNIKYRPAARWELVGYIDFGPHFIGGYESYQGIGVVNAILSKHIVASLGYRYYYVDSARDDVLYRGSITGLLVRLCAQF